MWVALPLLGSTALVRCPYVRESAGNARFHWRVPGTNFCGTNAFADLEGDPRPTGALDGCCLAHDLCCRTHGECTVGRSTVAPCRCDEDLVACLGERNRVLGAVAAAVHSRYPCLVRDANETHALVVSPGFKMVRQKRFALSVGRGQQPTHDGAPRVRIAASAKQ